MPDRIPISARQKSGCLPALERSRAANQAIAAGPVILPVCGWPITMKKPIASSAPTAPAAKRFLKRQNRHVSKRSVQTRWKVCVIYLPSWIIAIIICRLARLNGDDSAIVEAVRVVVREALTGDAPPASTAMVMDLWRPWIKARAGDLLEEMRDAEGDQQQFAELSKRLITVLQSEMGDTAENNEDGDDTDDGSQDNNEDGQSDEAQSATGEDDTSDEDGQSLEQDGDAAGMASEDAAEMGSIPIWTG